VVISGSNLNSLLAVLRQRYTRLRSQLSERPYTATSCDAIQESVFQIIESAIEIREEVDDLIGRGESPIVNSGRELWRFFEEEFRPIERVFSLQMFEDANPYDLYDAIEASSRSTPQARLIAPDESCPIAEAIGIALARTEPFAAENFDDWEIHDYYFREAIRLTSYKFFQPDSWIDNLRLLPPVVLARPQRNLKTNIRRRLNEVYRSFIFGNWMAVLALSRSLLEFVLKEHAATIGVELRGHQGRPKGLDELKGQYVTKFPDLNDPFDLVQMMGNIVMHPSKANDVVHTDEALRRDALAVIDALCKILMRVYDAEPRIRA
jgi:hypothetical protein